LITTCHPKFEALERNCLLPCECKPQTKLAVLEIAIFEVFTAVKMNIEKLAASLKMESAKSSETLYGITTQKIWN